ncbi:leucine-rich repeat protein kinase family protein [Striga asiatica]|uniref:Leucine-rich repeat protein kinase family protein n=1 Tax=Striga asiatica TaxID=4170 RepID=A0A5A7PAT9_STRAF|nr:leucine-rich repeat protein kinase family protein [Striga asiatica]
MTLLPLLIVFSLLPFCLSLSSPFSKPTICSTIALFSTDNGYSSLFCRFVFSLFFADYSLHIDCGGLVDTTDAFHTDWLSDRFYSGGSVAVVSEPLRFVHQQEKTLRHFPISSGKKNCYSIPLPTSGAGGGRYLLRTFTVYDNFDGKSHSPSFDVSVRGTLVFSWRSPWPAEISRSGAYSDLFFHHDAAAVDLCFYSIATDSPVIGSLEVYQIDARAYPFDHPGNSSAYILINYGRFSSGSGRWGPGFTNDTDFFGRTWLSGSEFRRESISAANGATVKAISAIRNVTNVERSPNYFPAKLYETAATAFEHGGGGGGGGVLEYELPVDAKLDYLLIFHFAEIDVSVTRAGQRVFDVVVNGKNASRVDVFKEVGGFAAYDWSYLVMNLSSTILSVRLVPVVGSPVICGLENYAIVQVDLRTTPDQVVAMRALKASLHVPERMGWNGDPCAPTTWDAWEGVTCHPSKDESYLVVSQIDLGSQGLKGYISDQIGLLTNLVSLDLSNNKFTGFIPDSLTSSSLQLVLLNDNALEGQVPEELYSIGVHGGAIDLSRNKRLCGVPSLPDCPLFWGKNGLSTGAKVGIGLSCMVILFLLLLGLYYFCKRRHNDYGFGLPHELIDCAKGYKNSEICTTRWFQVVYRSLEFNFFSSTFVQRLLDGKTTKIWEHPWVPNIQGFTPTGKNHINSHLVWVKELMDDTGRRWNKRLIEDSFPKHESEAILKIEGLDPYSSDRI